MRDELRIQHILEAFDDIEKIIEGKDLSTVMESVVLRHALRSCCITIGEASHKISGAVRNKYRSIPWDNMKDIRNSAVHEYFTVDYEEMWFFAKETVPLLKEKIRRIGDELKAVSDEIHAHQDMKNALDDLLNGDKPFRSRKASSKRKNDDSEESNILSL